MESFRGQSLETIVQRTRLPMIAGDTRVAVSRVSALARRIPLASPSRRLRFVVDVKTYPPTTRAGSERSLDAVLQWLGRRGHDVRVLVPPDQASGPYGDVEVLTPATNADRWLHYAWCNVV